MSVGDLELSKNEATNNNVTAQNQVIQNCFSFSIQVDWKSKIRDWKQNM